MKVLFYTDTPNTGGAERQMLMLAAELKRLGHTVDLAYGAYSRLTEMRPDFEKVCGAVFELPVLHKHDPRHYTRLKKILKAGGYDLLHIHLWNPGAGRYAFWAGRSMGVPIVTTEHDPFMLGGLKGWLKRRCLRVTARTICLSGANADLMREADGVPEEKIAVVPNGIEAEPFLNASPAHDLPVKPGDIVVTCVAELHPRKGHEFLLKAFERLTLREPRLQLMLAGRGPLETSLRERFGALPNVHFLGWRNDVPALLKASDMVVLPSLKEAFGLAVLEAMATGRAVIATQTAGPLDIIEDGKMGLLVPPGNSEALEDAILKLVDHPEEKVALEKAALERVKERYTAKIMAERTAAVYAL